MVKWWWISLDRVATAPAPASDGADAARTGPRPSVGALEIRRDSRLIYSDQKTKFSELVGTTRQKEGRPRIPGGAVFKKVRHPAMFCLERLRQAID